MEYAMNDFIRGWSKRSEIQVMPVAPHTDILLTGKESIVKTIIRLGYGLAAWK